MTSTKTVLEELTILAQRWFAYAMKEKSLVKKRLAQARAQSFAHAACLILGKITPIYAKIKKSRLCK